MKKIILILALFYLSACTTTLQELKETKPVGTKFEIELAKNYMEFAESEADQFDWFDSAYFAKKGLMAANGVKVQPENLENWSIPALEYDILKQGRGYLVEALSGGMREKHPEQSAFVQFLFDCWIEQQEENWQNDHISICREGFYEELDVLFSLKHSSKAKKAKIEPEEEQVKDEGAGTKKYVVYFDLNKASPNKKSKKILIDIAAVLKNKDKYDIALNGHSDRAGNPIYNMKLSKKRAEGVKKELVDLGLKPSNITTFSFGESQGVNETKDGEKDPASRRVEIIVTY